jgi:DNA mismatch repair protein MutS2
VPAAEADFPWFETVLADIGDAQSIEASLSTFSAHIETLKGMLDAAQERSLVIIDELGGATDPDEGGALAVAVVDRFIDRGAFALVSTHLPALKIHAAAREEIVSAAMGFDDHTLSPTHRLLVGVPGQSAGLAMAARLGLPEDVIARARTALAEREQEAGKFLERLRRSVEDQEERERKFRVEEQRLRERERDLEREAEQREKKKIAELERRFQHALREAQDANQRALEEALAKVEKASEGKRALVNAQRMASRTQRESRERLQTAVADALGKQTPATVAAAPPSLLREGATVKLGGFGATGRILRKIGDDRWEVQAGQLKMQITSEDVTQVLEESPGQQKRSLPSGVSFTPAAKEGGGRMDEINVIGRTVDEAESEVDKFLDHAVLAEIERVRVIHGHGSNALRRGLWRFFANHPHVEKYYQAETAEGGGGATIVELKV